MTSFFFLITQNKLKILLKTSLKKTNNSMESLRGHVDKPSNDYDVNKMIKEKDHSTNQSMLMGICQLEICCQHELQRKTI